MKIGISCNPVEPHIVFAWIPVLVVDRANNEMYYAWFEQVERKLVSIQGVAQWVYSPKTNTDIK